MSRRFLIQGISYFRIRTRSLCVSVHADAAADADIYVYVHCVLGYNAFWGGQFGSRSLVNCHTIRGHLQFEFPHLASALQISQ